MQYRCKILSNKLLPILLVFLIAFANMLPVLAADEAPDSVFSSQLKTGRWVKIQIPQTGVYKIKYAKLQEMGFPDPSKVSVHGYGGWPMEEDFSLNCIDDIPPTAVYRGSDYIMFFGRGPLKWEYSYYTNTFIHTNNPYSVYGYYFLTDATETKDVKTEASTENGPSLTISTYDEYRVYEQELVSVNESGRELFGESFAGGGSIKLSSPVFNIPGITNDDAKVTMRFIARSKNTAGQATLNIDGQNLLRLSFQPVGINDIYTKATSSSLIADWKGAKSEQSQVTVSYNKTGDENVYLDYIRLHVNRTLRQYGDYTFFRSIASIENTSRFVLSNANDNTVVFDVTDPLEIVKMETKLVGNELSFTIPAGDLREFVAVQVNQNLDEWKSIGEIKNQDLHGFDAIDMIIIAQSGIFAQAERLAERHRKDNLRVKVVTPQQIYNEFSSGTPDVTAYRRFMKMLYDRAGTEDDKPKYLLLFGDGAYDNRKLTNEWKKINTDNMLLTYQSTNSLDQYSFVTDDYFGALDNNIFTTAPIKLGIGRFPVRTLTEATLTVDKVLLYMDNKDNGDWKNRACFVADDGSASDRYDIEHENFANQLADTLKAKSPDFMVNKLFFDAYKKTGSTYPDIHEGILKQLKDGLLILNYTGHGDTEKWSDEAVLTSQDIAKFTHTHLPLWITATCDFTRFDHPKTSAGEDIFLQKSGGIAMLTTTRVVYSNENFGLNIRLINELVKKDKDGRYPTLGDAIRNTKSTLYDTNKLNFILIGDPAMRLNYPENRILVTNINGNDVDNGKTIEFKALDKVTIQGEIQTRDGSPMPDFSGTLNITVFDSKQTRTTLDNNRTGNTFSFNDYPYRLFVGNDVVRNGKFEISFTVPKDISYSNDYGLINLYASSENAGDANGSFENFTVGGWSEKPDDDTEGPEIRQLYLNDSTFINGGAVNPTPLFVARIWDKSGVNISGGSVGHDITISIDNQPVQTYILNSYYHLIPETNGEGIVQFSIPALSKGMHTAEFRVWDVLNNPTVHTFSFEVIDDLKPKIADIVATPVPARTSLQFLIYHNMPESNIYVGVMVYDMTGKLKWKTERSASSGSGEPLTIDWNLVDNNGTRLRQGMYIYKAFMRTSSSGEETKAKKLLILAQ